MNKFFLIITICVLFFSCGRDTDVDLSEFILSDENLQIELVAAEPLIESPVAMIEDERGRLWVAEMPGYMRNIDGEGEDIADGRIIFLTDIDEDGMMDERTVFLDSLLNPRAISFVYDGLLYTDGTMLKWTDLQNVKSEIVDSLYVIGGNIEHQPNGLLYNLDNWIYSAKSNVRYQRKDGVWKKEATTFRGQWGISMNHDGRLIYNHNSAPFYSDYSMPNLILQNEYMPVEASTSQLYVDDYRIFPLQATAVNRGYQDGVLDENEKIINYTSACAPHAFYGENLGTDYYTDVFVCAPEINAIVNYNVDYSSFEMKAERATENEEFLISKDESFRPVNLVTGHDGALYLVDIRKGIIQHTAYMSSYLREKILKRGLDKINNKGRIYKISNKEEKVKPYNLKDFSEGDCLPLLQENNLQLRMFAQKKLVHGGNKDLKEGLITIAKDKEFSHGQIHALWTLHGMDLLDVETLLAVSNISDKDVLNHVLILSKFFPNGFDKLYDESFILNDKRLDYSMSQVFGSQKDKRIFWKATSIRYPNDLLISEALVSGISDNEKVYLEAVHTSDTILTKLLTTTIENRKNNELQIPQIMTATFDDDRTNGLKIFKVYCAACHGLDGRGQKEVAPSLVASNFLKGEDIEIAKIIFNGYESDSKEYKIPMPLYINDPSLSDQDVVDIISYLKSSFTSDWSRLKVEEVEELRKELKGNINSH